MNGTYNLVTECKAKSTSLFSVEAIVVVFIRKKYSLEGQNTGEFGRF